MLNSEVHESTIALLFRPKHNHVSARADIFQTQPKYRADRILIFRLNQSTCADVFHAQSMYMC